LAFPWVVESPVFDPVEEIALLHDRATDEGLGLRRDGGHREVAGVRVHRLVDVRVAPSGLFGPAVRRGTGDDAVEVLGVALRLHQRLPTPA
jgi:hypothetical protein